MSVRVIVPTQLRGYTDGKSEVDAAGATLAAVLADLDRQFPGFRFRVIDEQDRVRQHMNIFVAGVPTRSLDARVGADDEVCIIQALSGG